MEFFTTPPGSEILPVAAIIVGALLACWLARIFVHGIVKALLDREATEGTAQELSAVELRKRMDTLDDLGAHVIQGFIVAIAVLMVIGELGFMGEADKQNMVALQRWASDPALLQSDNLVVLVTDFRGPRNWRQPLVALAARHHVLAVEIDDPREAELVDIGELTLVDAETGREVRVDTSSQRLRDRYAAAAAAERASVATTLRRIGVDHLVLSTAGDWLRRLAAELHVRGIRA